jgi:hypothetical protein
VAAKSKTTGFYRDDAAELAAGAARTSAPPAPKPIQAPPAQPPSDRAPPIRIIDPDRPPLKPQAPINQNLPVLRAYAATSIGTAPMPRKARPSRTVARVLIAPLYIAMALASAGVLLLFVKAWLGF